MDFWLIFGIIYGIATWIANMFLCHRLAESKNRSSGGWVAFAFFFGILSTLILAGLDKLTEEERYRKENYKRNYSDDDVKKRFDI